MMIHVHGMPMFESCHVHGTSWILATSPRLGGAATPPTNEKEGRSGAHGGPSFGGNFL
jgi:hypothetical protein